MANIERQYKMNSTERKKMLAEVFYGTKDYNKLNTKQKALIQAIIKKHSKNPTNNT